MKWEMVRFIDVVQDITGGNQKFQSSEYCISGKYPIIDQGDSFIGGYTDVNAVVKRIRDVIVFGDHTKALKFIDFDFCLGADGVKVLQPSKDLHAKFLYYYLKTINLPSVGYSRHYKFLKDIQIPLPPLAIQKRIAEVLDAADALRRKDQQLLQKYDELAQAVFVDMFGDPVRNEKGWEVKRLGDELKSIRYGTGSPPQYSENGIPFLRATNIKAGRIEKKGMVFVAEKDAQKISKCFISEGDLIIVRSGANTGDCAYISTEYANCLAGYDLIVEMDRVKSCFYNYFLNSIWGKEIIKKLSRRAGQPHLNSEQVSGIECIAPDYTKLEKFKLKIDTIESLRKLSIRTNDVSVDLFQTLLHQAFNGELITIP